MARRPVKHIREEKNRHGKTVYYYRRGRERFRLPDEYGTDEFWNAYDSAVAGKPIQHVKDQSHRKTAKRRAEVEIAVAMAVKRAKNRAKSKGRPFAISIDWAIEECRRNNYRCALTMVPFAAGEKVDAAFMRPFVPSIDRIDNSKGYEPGNVRLVVFAVNMMMAEWGEEVMHRVANGYRYVKNKQRQEFRRTFGKVRRTST